MYYSLNLIRLDSTLTLKVIDMPKIHLQSCLDQDVMMVTVKYIDKMFIIRWNTFTGLQKGTNIGIKWFS